MIGVAADDCQRPIELLGDESAHDLVRQSERTEGDDEIGTINLITPDVRRRAAECVSSGKSFSLALPLSESEGIQIGLLPGRVRTAAPMTSSPSIRDVWSPKSGPGSVY